ncbi:type II secretion system F family protein [Aureliella helgolandensis]|uniref:Type II secretion system protein F n=1 Tax=Aureliella helgolandensis TaxID=2527968 RepID=A0A518G7K1_9BACT|nr:type II secretion system F family protein [Aureliella helgolandensis]QDV24558.1 Putative type II secretion system protein F [Aureliella helgolandensis]
MFDLFGILHSRLTESYRPGHSKASNWRSTPLWDADPQASVQASLVQLLSFAHRQRQPLAPLISGLAEEQRGVSRRRLRRLAMRLEQGMPLVDALEQTPGVLSDESVLTLRLGVQSGTLPAAFAALAGEDPSSRVHFSYRIRQALAYAAGLTLAFGFVGTFILVLIAPTFQKMLEEFGMAPVTVWQFSSLMTVTSYLSHYLPLFIALGVLLGILIWLTRPIRIFQRTWAARLLATVAQRRAAHMLQMFALVTDAGRPLPSVLSTLARYHFDRYIRSRLLFARNEVEQGAEPWESLASAQLLSPEECRAISSLEPSQSRSWLMRRLADWKLVQADRVASMIVACLHPLVVIAFGLVVLWIATAFIGMLSFMISSLA